MAGITSANKDFYDDMTDYLGGGGKGIQGVGTQISVTDSEVTSKATSNSTLISVADSKALSNSVNISTNDSRLTSAGF